MKTLMLTLLLAVLATSATACDYTLTSGNPWQSTIQPQINAASGYSTFVVCVEAATYTGCGTGVTMVTGRGGPVHVVGLSDGVSTRPTIDCGGSGRAVNVTATVHDIVLRNLRIVNGAETEVDAHGGAVRVTNGASVLVDSCAVEDTADSAVYATLAATVTIVNSSFVRCEASSGAVRNGGAVSATSGTIVAVNSVFAFNSAADYGGAINVDMWSTLILENSTVVENTAFVGGGLYIFTADANITGTVVANNTAPSALGGGALVDAAVVYFTDSAVTGNVAFNGAGLKVVMSTLYFTKSSLSRNSASSAGGGAHMSDSEAIFVNTTINGNTADSAGGLRVESGTLSCYGGSFTGNTGNTDTSVTHIATAVSSAVLDGVLISDNSSPGSAVFGPRTMTLVRCTVTGNTGMAVSAWGGHLLVVEDTVVSCNVAETAPAAGNRVDFRNSTVIRNNYRLKDSSRRYMISLPTDSVNWEELPNQDPRECPGAPKLCDLPVGCAENGTCDEPDVWVDANGCWPVGPNCTCGNGFVDTCGDFVETCDDSNRIDDDACSAECVDNVCGDGRVTAFIGETCDDGNGIDDDDCSNNCTLNCGNGVLDASSSEECDDGNSVDGDGCESDCTLSCGNGVVDTNNTEACDDGNTVDNDDCSNSCVLNCGNGVIDGNSTEACDDGNSVDDDTCSNSCALNCGNGVVDGNSGEECDDGNAVDNDDCSNNCEFNCGNAVVDGSEACDDGNTVNDDDCSNNCTANCGNGVLDASGSEECDDGNSVDNDDCSNNCTFSCGNGVVDGSEECDDGNSVDGDVCSNACTLNCGNGVVDVAAGEECDDGNGVNNDDCSNSCTLNCGNGVVDANSTEECDDGNSASGDLCNPDCTLPVYTDFTTSASVSDASSTSSDSGPTATGWQLEDDDSANNVENNLAEEEAQQRRRVVVASSVSAATVGLAGFLGLLLFCVRRRAKVDTGDDGVVILEDGVEVGSEGSGSGSGDDKAVGSSSE